MMIKLGLWFATGSFLVFGGPSATASEAPAATAGVVVEVAAVPPGQTVDFSRQILPIFRRSCLACHNSKDAEGGVILESPDLIAKGGESGPAVLPGDGAGSLLLKLASRAEKPFMPPRNNKAGAPPLTPDELGLVQAWINQGATGVVAQAFPVTRWNAIPETVRRLNAIAVTPDGRYLVANRGSRLHLHSAVTGELCASLADPSIPDGAADHDIIQTLAVSPDAEWLASGAYKSLKLWRRDHSWAKAPASTPAEPSPPALAETVLAALRSPAKRIVPSGDGSRLAVILEDGRLGVVETAGEQKLSREFSPGSPIRQAAWSAGAPRLVAVAADEVVRVLDAGDGKTIAEFREHPDAGEAATRARRDDVRAGLLVAHLQTFLDSKVDFEKKEAEALAKAKEKLEQQEKAHQAKLAEKTGADEQLAKARADLEAAQKDAEAAPIAAAAAEKRKADAAAALVAAGTTLESSSRRLAELEPAIAQIVKQITEGGFSLRVAELRLAEAKLAKSPDEAALASEVAAKLDALKKSLGEHKSASTEWEAAEGARSQAVAAVAALKTEAEEAEKAISQAKSLAEDSARRIPESKKRLEESEKRLAGLVEPLRVVEGARDGAMQALKSIQDSIERAKAAIEQAKAELAVGKAQKDALAQEFQARSEAAKIPRPVAAAALSHDGGLAAVLHSDGSIVVWATTSGQCVNVLRSEPGFAAVSVEFDSGNALRIASSDSGALVAPIHARWTLAHAVGAGGEDAPFADRVMALDFAPDSKVIAVGGGFPSRGGEIHLFSVADGKELKVFKDLHSDTVLALRFSPDGASLLTGGADKFARAVEVSSGRQFVAFEGHTHHVQAVAWTGAGRTVATASADKTVKIWDLATGEQRKTHGGFGKELNSVNYLSPEQGIQVSSGDSQLKWMAEDGKEIRRFNGASGFMAGAAVDLGGGVVVGGALDGVVRVWEGATGKLRLTLPPPEVGAVQTAKK